MMPEYSHTNSQDSDVNMEEGLEQLRMPERAEQIGQAQESHGINSKLSANSKLSEIVELSKRRGFVFQNSEIYGGFSSSYDYGPLGALMLKNLRDLWVKELVQKNSNIVMMDGSIISHPRTWEASGHVEKFNDPLVQDLSTGKR